MRSFLKLVALVWVWVIVSLVGVLVYIQQTPYPAPPQAVTMLTDCGEPCFIGIIPGETTPDDALTLLENHPLITNIQHDTNAMGDEHITWNYTETAGTGLSTLAPAELRYRQDDTTVQYMSIYLDLPLWYLVEAYGQPPHLRADGVRDALLVSVAWKPNNYASVYSAPTCPLIEGYGIWELPVQRMEVWVSDVTLTPMRTRFPWKACL